MGMLWICVLGLVAFDVAALLFLLIVAKYSKPCTDEEAAKCLFTISD